MCHRATAPLSLPGRILTTPGAGMISDDAVARARDVTVDAALAELAPGHRLRRSGAELVGPCPVCGGDDRFAIHLRRSVWNCRGCGIGGDAIALVKHLRDLDFPDAVEFLVGGATAPRRPVERPAAARPRDTAPATTASHAAAQASHAADRRARAQAIWQAAVPIPGTPAQAYLATRFLQFHDPEGSVLRFHPRARFYSTDLPCLVALYRRIASNAPCAVQLTLLEPGGWRPGRRTQRQTVGTWADAACKLSRDADVTMGLCIGEGVETVLAGMAAGFQPAWAVGSAGAIAAFPLLAGIESLTLLVDADPAGRAAAAECAARWEAAGREVFTVTPAAAGQDIADVVREARHG